MQSCDLNLKTFINEKIKVLGKCVANVEIQNYCKKTEFIILQEGKDILGIYCLHWLNNSTNIKIYTSEISKNSGEQGKHSSV